MPIDAVVFDYGNVLSLAQPDSVQEELAARCGLERETLTKFYWDQRADYDAGLSSGHDYWHEIARLGGCTMTAELARELIDIDNKGWSLENGLLSEFARIVRKSGMRTAILSNMPLDFRNHLAVGVPWLPEFDHHTYSCELHVIKPDMAIYEHCISGLGAAPERTLFIDDREINLEAARKHGWQTILFRTTEQTLNDCSKLCGISVPA